MLYGAAAGLAVILTAAVMLFVRVGANKRRGQTAYIVIPSGTDPAALRRRVRAFCTEQLFCDPRYRCGIVILLTDERLSGAANELCVEFDGVSTAARGELDSRIAAEYDGLQKTDG